MFKSGINGKVGRLIDIFCQYFSVAKPYRGCLERHTHVELSTILEEFREYEKEYHMWKNEQQLSCGVDLYVWQWQAPSV